MTRSTLRVGIAGCGLIGAKRAASLGADSLVGCSTSTRGCRRAARRRARGGGLPLVRRSSSNSIRTSWLSRRSTAPFVPRVRGARRRSPRPRREAGGREPSGCRGDPGGARGRLARLVKVGFNHRFFPGIARAVGEARSGMHGAVMFARGPLRPRRPPRLRAGVASRSGASGRRGDRRPGHAPARPLPLAARCPSAAQLPAPYPVLGRTSGRQRRSRPRGAGRRREPGSVGAVPRQLDRVEEHVLPGDLLRARQAGRGRPEPLLRAPGASDLPHEAGAWPPRRRACRLP